MTAFGVAVLLMHSNVRGDVKEQVLADLTHLPIAVLGIGAGAAR
jgi:hypothetical protein